ncbi:MAG: phosphatase PAP2 family protein, partial [Silvanigrellaceae bacterium]|nr:phosphatase PAP2 family protein [Silvanigrellaceae bacterium]
LTKMQIPCLLLPSKKSLLTKFLIFFQFVFLHCPCSAQYSFEFKSTKWSSYSPGLWEQDIFTLPLEGMLGFMVTKYHSPRATPFWPYEKETNNKTKKSSQLPSRKLMPPALLISSSVLAGLSLSNESFNVFPHLRGWLHSILLTELATTSSKVMFQRHRPFFDTTHSSGQTNHGDDSFSFISGHASQAFSFATYASGLMLKYCDSSYISWPFTVTSFGLASWVSSTRVTGHQHHVDDVIAGGIVGTLITAVIFLRVEDVIGEHYQGVKIYAQPTLGFFSSEKTLPMLNITVEF